MTLDRLLRTARDGRCLLREKWQEGADLPGRDQLQLAKALLAIKPATVERHGHRAPCEPSFQLRPKDRRRLTEALLRDGVCDGEVLAVVPDLTRRTFERIRSDVRTRESEPANGSVERRFATKRDAPVCSPWEAYLDATTGADLEAEQRFRELVGGVA